MGIKKSACFIAFLLVFSLLASGFCAEDKNPMNLNSVTVEELAKIPGIDQDLAEGIIEARDENGEFIDMEELLDVGGIDEALLQQIEKHLMIEELDECNC